MGRLARWSGLLRVGIARAAAHATHTARQRVQFSVIGVAIAIALLVTVTGVGIGLATNATVYDDDTDYWIVPEGGGGQSPLVATDTPRFGSAHDSTRRLTDIDGVDGATPVVTQVLRVEADGTDEYVLVVGVVNTDGIDRVLGLELASLTAEDPYYADGAYDGEWTGEVVLSETAAGLLDASTGDPVTIGGNDSFTVAGTAEAAGPGGDVPMAIVQLSELQVLIGADTYDQADQFVVRTNTPAVEAELAGVYPQSNVLTRGELTATETLESDLPLALAATAFVVAVAIGTLFVGTSMGLELAADRQRLATMSAIGVSTRSQLALVGVQTLVTTGLGGLLGSLAGLAIIWLLNAGATSTVTTEPVAVSHPVFVPYGVGVALVIGVLSLPYLLVLTRRITGGVP